MTADDDPVAGWIDPRLASELPELRLWWTETAAGPPKSPRALKHRLKDLSSRVRGAQATALRSQPIPHAYRVFFRHIGLDPDVERVPIEALVVERLKHGGFRSGTTLEDAVTVAVMETSVPVWALDAERVSGALGIRGAHERERLGRHDERTAWLPGGRLVVADDHGPVAILFGDIAPGHGISTATRRAVLFSVQVAGVPAIHVSEALWTVADIVEQVTEDSADRRR